MRDVMRTRLLVAAAMVFALVVAPVALAGNGGDSRGPKATASASLKKKVKNLKQQLGAQQEQLAALQGQVDTLARQPGPQGEQGEQGPPGPATGAAGGDLTGNYPNPLIDNSAVNSAKVDDNTLTDDDLAASAQFNSAAAGGDLAGTYPSPDIGAVQTPITGTGALDAGSITPGFGAVNIGAADVFTGSGSGLTNLDASDLSTGGVPTARLNQSLNSTSPGGFTATGNAGVPILIAANLDGTGNDVTIFTNQVRAIQIIDAWSVNNLNSHSASATWRLTDGTNPITDTVEVDNGASADFHDINRAGEVQLSTAVLSGNADLVIDVVAGSPFAQVYILAMPR